MGVERAESASSIHVAALQRLANRFRWISRIRAPDAGGLVFYGAEAHAADFGHADTGLATVSLTGTGFSCTQAFAGCVGEGAERLSHLEWGDETLTRAAPRDLSERFAPADLDGLLALLGTQEPLDDVEMDWMPAHELIDASAALLPAEICLRRAHDRLLGPRALATSTGCAAGRTFESAVLAGLLEIIERDAAALWWSGGVRARPLSMDALGDAGAGGLLAALRAGCEGRQTWVMDITTDIRVPSVVALSVDQTGRQLATGLAARPRVVDAVAAALLELGQSELGYHLVEAKRELRGEARLNDADRRKLHRATAVDASSHPLLHPGGVPREHVPAPTPDVATAIREVTDAIKFAGYTAYAVDLTRPRIGVPVARVVAPGLQPYPSCVTTDRLRAARGQTRRYSFVPMPCSLF